jgi:polyisoprenyl-phosphate glycosyltransferase
MRVSVAIPMLNEAAVLPALFRRVRSVLDSIPGGPHEIVVVDDGSSDRTPELLEQEAAHDPRVVAIVLSRNFGHQAAITAALEYASGDVVIVMDGDLQDPPEAIPLFLEKYEQGNDIVYAQRASRKEVWWLRLCYALFYRLLALLSSARLPLDAGDFGLMSRRVVDELRGMTEYHRYLRGLRGWVGFQQTGIPMARQERLDGKSKYSAVKLLQLASDGIFSFSIVPLRLAAGVGALAIFLSGGFALYAVFAKLFLSQSPRGFAALILVVSFLSGVQLFFMGVIGEYVGRLYEASKARPLYIVAQQFGGSRTSRDQEHADFRLISQEH